MPDIPVIVVTGTPAWGDITVPGFQVETYQDRTNYVTRLADDRAALILVDGTREDWTSWCAIPKSSAATRRIPIFVVADHVDPDSARKNGADGVILIDELPEVLPALAAERARVMSEATAEALDEQCAETPPPDVLEAVRLFNSGEFYKQHDLFEALWMDEERPVRDLYRAVLQVGVAYYQVTRGNPRGAHKMLLRSVQWLDLLPDTCQGIDIAALKADSAAVRAELERLLEGTIDTFDQSLLKPVRLLNL